VTEVRLFKRLDDLCHLLGLARDMPEGNGLKFMKTGLDDCQSGAKPVQAARKSVRK
jgi:hypothetical protein